MTLAGYVLLGVVAGVFSGLLGIGGGTIVVPALALLFGMAFHKAQGTLLAAFLLPVVFSSVWKYSQTGNVDWKAAVFIAIGIFLGGYFGASLSLSLSETTIKRVFGVFLVLVAIKLFSGK